MLQLAYILKKDKFFMIISMSLELGETK